jgi:hypothetical protein
MIVCPRCKTKNSRWERRCKACWLHFDAALRAQSEAPVEAVGDDSDAGDSDERQFEAQEAKRAGARDVKRSEEYDPQHHTLAQLLGVEVAHVRALADAGIHTLEHIAESIPEQIGHALGDLTHIDPAALIARARHLLQPTRPPEPEPAPKREPPPKTPQREPDPAEWWKMT